MLLALNHPDALYTVREGGDGEKPDLVAECDLKRVGLRMKISMRLVPEKHEVRVVHERWVSPAAGHAKVEYGRGHAPSVFTEKRTVLGNDGRKRRDVVFRFDTRQVTTPLEVAVLRAGWKWRGVIKL
ncbi:hypothetical protein ACFYM2_01455 [Streptomyces sp. NPDC006711]|uniref:hypothetical protein n=1 Tax=unclassified Streptomyces TaxID=2593676 RepID=UPI0033CF575D